jgi:hypothetical protein
VQKGPAKPACTSIHLHRDAVGVGSNHLGAEPGDRDIYAKEQIMSCTLTSCSRVMELQRRNDDLIEVAIAPEVS